MMLRVIYNHGGHDLVKDHMLDHYLERGVIAGFQRWNGWAVIGRDQIRRRSRKQTEEQFLGIERRGRKPEDSTFVRW